MSITSEIVKFVLEGLEDYDDIKDVTMPDMVGRVNPAGKTYGTSILYGNYRLTWHDYPDGSRLVDLAYKVPFQLYWRKDKKGQPTDLVRREVPHWSGGTEIIKLKAPFDWEKWLLATFKVLDKTPDCWAVRRIPELPEQWEVEEQEIGDE